jgi:putative membrane protein
MSASDDPIREKSAVPLDTTTRLAFENAYLAHENTRMSWVRTALGMISFGFTIAKFFEVVREKQGTHATLLDPPTVGILMIVIGLVALALSSVQQGRAVKALREQCPSLPKYSVAGSTAAAIWVLGILALLGAILR